MLTTMTSQATEVIEKVEKYADEIILEKKYLIGEKPESIDTGVSGIALLLIDLYRYTGKEKYLNAADRLISSLLNHCKTHPNNDYSLYKGRGSVIYLLIMRYHTGGGQSLIEECLDLIRPADKEYLHSAYTSDYLYEGRAGTLLLILNLYLISRESFLVDYMNNIFEKMLVNATLTDDGLSWNNREEVNLKAPCGFAHGTAGIVYVLKQLNHYCRHEGISFLIGEMERF